MIESKTHNLRFHVLVLLWSIHDNDQSNREVPTRRRKKKPLDL